MTKTISDRLQFIDSARFIATSLSNPVNNLPKGIHRTKYKYWHDDKNAIHVELNTKIRSTFLNTQTLKII